MTSRPTFEELNRAALARFEQVMGWLGLSGGKRQGHEYLPLNPRRGDHTPGSFSINTTSGAWGDFADDAKGGDLVSLAAYIRGEGNGAAARWLGEALGYGGTGEAPPAAPAAPNAAPGEPAGGVWVHPVPIDAPRPPAGSTRHGKPSQVWTYRDEAGGVLFYHCRFDPRGGRKQFAPLTLWRDKSGNLAWSWKWPPAPVPLYGLHVLPNFPDVPFIVVEGEKAADAAAVLFPNHPVLTWCGGAGAVGKADLAPLAGREVLVWPDADAPGEQAARKLIFRLREVGAGPIKRINLDLLAQRPTLDSHGRPGLVDGAPLEEGDDAADLLAQDWTAAHMSLLLDAPGFLLMQADPAGTGPASQSEAESTPATASSNFEMTDVGLFFHGDKGSFRVCPPFTVLAKARDPEGAGWGLLVELIDPDNLRHRPIIPFRTLRGDGAAALEVFLDRGLIPGAGRDKFLVEYLRGVQTDRRARVVARMGWHGEADNAVYVLPDKTYGAAPGEVWLLEPDGPRLNPFKTRGTLADWRAEVATLCGGNSRLLFACSVAFAAPMINLTGAENGGVNFIGSSGTGKTTVLRVGASVCGSGDYLERLRATDNGLEQTFMGKCDAPAFLDEMGQLGPQIAGEAVYMAANGQAKARATRTGGMRERATWRTLFLLSSEVSLAGHMAEAGKAPKAGQQTRLADVGVDAGAGLGAFENLHLYASGHEFAQALARACSSHYGTAYAAFLSRLMHERGPRLLDHLREQIRSFERKYLTDSAEGQARRVAMRFGLIGAAGELAREWLELPWQEGEALRAAGDLFTTWLTSRGGEGNQEDRAMLAQVRDFLTRHGEARFTDWDRPASDTDARGPRVINRAGFRRITFETSGRPPEDQETEYLIFPQVWAGEVCKGFDPAAVARLLAKRGALKTGDDDRPARSLTLPGEGKRRVYNITPYIWVGES